MLLTSVSPSLQLLGKKISSNCSLSKRYLRSPFGIRVKPSFEERNRVILKAHETKRLKLAEPIKYKPNQWRLPPPPKDPKVVKRPNPTLSESYPPYQKYTNEDIKSVEGFETYYDPLFNPHLHEERHRVNPDEEPFNAIYNDSQSESANDYTKVRNITTPELWDTVKRLERIKIAPEIKRKDGDPIVPLPCGIIPPPETPPDLPYFVPRTRNYLLPVYYRLESEPDKCYTLLNQVAGDIWKLEEDVRTHLEGLGHHKGKILSSVQETDARIMFRGKHLHQIVDWLHLKGF